MTPEARVRRWVDSLQRVDPRTERDQYPSYFTDTTQLIADVTALLAATTDVGDLLAAIGVAANTGNFWALRAWAKKHDVYIDDLGDVRAMQTLAVTAEKVLRVGLAALEVPRDHR